MGPMTEAPRTPNPSTAELPAGPAGASVAQPATAQPATAQPGPDQPVPAVPGPVATGPIPVGTPPTPGPDRPAPAGDRPEPASAAQPPGQPTVPVPPRPRVGPRRPGPLTRMGPWAPAFGAVLGLVAGLVSVFLLAGVAEAFAERLALVFLTVGLAMLGAAGALLADEVRLVRRGAREAGIRPAWVEATANLINGLTPARLLLLASSFVLFLAAFVS